MKTLHILNGDATLYVFKDTKIAGDILVWREILAEGPVSKNDLWNTRTNWVCENFKTNLSSYQEMVIDEGAKKEDLSGYHDILLWFEFDLVCQINLIYILKQLNEYKGNLPAIYLICPASFSGLPNFRGLGELNAVQLASLQKTKVKLQASDLQFASTAWDLYVENDPIKIATFLKQDFGNLSLLKPALAAHLSRFPAPITNLNHIEQVLMDIISSGVNKKSEIYARFWETEGIFGMTDVQIDYYLKRLSRHYPHGYAGFTFIF